MPDLNKEAPIDIELLETVASDLRYIAKVARGDPDFNALRRLSVQMRLLINDDLFIKAWKNLGVSKNAPAIQAVRIDATDADPAGYNFAGGGEYGGMQIAAFRYLPRAMTQMREPVAPKLGRLPEYSHCMSTKSRLRFL